MLTRSDIITKKQAAGMILRTQFEIPQSILDACILKMCKQNDSKFIREFRKSTDLNLCSFGPETFYIKYN